MVSCRAVAELIAPGRLSLSMYHIYVKQGLRHKPAIDLLQVARIAAAIALAPFLDAACSRARQQLGLKSQHTALSLVVASCLGLTILCFGGIVLFWA